MTHNDRPISDPNLQAALDEMKAICAIRGLAGVAMLVSPQEAAYFYMLHAPFSAIQFDEASPLGWRIRANSKRDGADVAHKRLEGAMHTVCSMADFGAQTQDWMEQIKLMLRQAGVDFDHTPFGGQPMPSLIGLAGR